jgi:PAS domain-containing protein
MTAAEPPVPPFVMDRPVLHAFVRELAAHERLRATGEPLTLEYRMLAADGRTVWIRDTAALAPASRGRVHGFAFDVTAEKRVLQELQASEQRYRLIVETAEEGIWLLDADGRTTFANEKLAQILGRTREELLGQHPSAFMDTDLHAELERALHRRLASGRGNPV